MTAETIEQTSALAVTEPRDTAVMPGFNSNSSWELAQRQGFSHRHRWCRRSIRGNLANCIVALEMANRMGASPLMVMQNLYIVHGNPGWSSKYLIACFNQCSPVLFAALRVDRRSQRLSRVGCREGNRRAHRGPTVTLEMAKAEGWSTKSGSKWRTMPELMLMYPRGRVPDPHLCPRSAWACAPMTKSSTRSMRRKPSASGLDAVRNALSKPAPVAAIGNAPSPTFDLPQHSSASKTAPTWPCCKSSATKCRT